jgi:hypothetical protein
MQATTPRNQSDAVDVQRRSALGFAPFAVAAGAAAALFAPSSAVAGQYFDLTGWYNAKSDFGAIGDGTVDDTTSLQTAISTAATTQRPLFLPPGTYRITQALVIPSNTVLLGSGFARNFGCRLQPVGCPALSIGGATEVFHCHLENFMIWPQGTAPSHLIRMDHCYSITIRNVRLHEAQSGQSGLSTAAIWLLGDSAVGGNGRCNGILWDNVIVRNDNSQPSAPAVLAERGCGSHRFISPNLENYQDLIVWRGGQLDLFTPYTERAGRFGIDCDPSTLDTTAYLNVFGGVLASAASGVPVAIRSNTRNFNAYGVSLEGAGTYAAYAYSLPGRTANFHGLADPNLSGTGINQFGGVAGWERAVAFPDLALKASTAWTGVSVPSKGQVSKTVTVTGARIGKHWARANLSVSAGNLQLSAHVTASDTVTVVAQNNTATAISFGATLLVEAGWL